MYFAPAVKEQASYHEINTSDQSVDSFASVALLLPLFNERLKNFDLNDVLTWAAGITTGLIVIYLASAVKENNEEPRRKGQSLDEFSLDTMEPGKRRHSMETKLNTKLKNNADQLTDSEKEYIANLRPDQISKHLKHLISHAVELESIMRSNDIHNGFNPNMDSRRNQAFNNYRGTTTQIKKAIQPSRFKK
ncbi:hypothetical protein KBD69_03635 [Candidatus Woesebacteria bacterium]|nr:hypothetical protein [Candidatus Woesebacteria bacterium]